MIEAINQIFNSLDARCVFILGMDRQMVASSIEVAYGDMVRHLERRGNPLAREYGYRFLSKIVQMSVSVPQASPGGMRNLLSRVTGSDAPPPPSAPKRGKEEGGRPLVQRPPPPEPPKEMVDEYRGLLRDRGLNNPEDPGLRGREIEAEIISDEVRKRALDLAVRAERADLFSIDSDHVRDAEFGGLEYLDLNPRQVKRFDNAYRLQLHVASTASDLEFRPEQLAAMAKWVAIRLRWPELAEDLDREPGLLAELE